MNYSLYLCVAEATIGPTDSAKATPPEVALGDSLASAWLCVQQLLEEFFSKPASPQAALESEVTTSQAHSVWRQRMADAFFFYPFFNCHSNH